MSAAPRVPCNFCKLIHWIYFQSYPHVNACDSCYNIEYNMVCYEWFLFTSGLMCQRYLTQSWVTIVGNQTKNDLKSLLGVSHISFYFLYVHTNCKHRNQQKSQRSLASPLLFVVNNANEYSGRPSSNHFSTLNLYNNKDNTKSYCKTYTVLGPMDKYDAVLIYTDWE